MDATITLSEQTYKLLTERAVESNRPVQELAEEAIARYLLPPHIEIVPMTSGLRAVIKGTRILVSTIISYLRAGETPESLTGHVIPNLSLDAINDALNFYHHHQAEIEAEIAENERMAQPHYLRERLSEDDFNKITGKYK